MGLTWTACLAPFLLFQASVKTESITPLETTTTTEVTSTTPTFQAPKALLNDLNNLVDQVQQLDARSSATEEQLSQVQKSLDSLTRSLDLKVSVESINQPGLPGMVILNDVMVASPCKDKTFSWEMSITDCQKKCEDMGIQSCRFIAYFSEDGQCYTYEPETTKGCKFITHEHGQVSFRPMAKSNFQYGMYRDDDIRVANGELIAEPMPMSYCRLVCALVPDCTIASWTPHPTRQCLLKKKNLSLDPDPSFNRTAQGFSWRLAK